VCRLRGAENRGTRIAIDMVMFHRSIRTRLLAVSVTAALTAPVAGCGTILYPERRGQTSGHVDVGVAVMDGLWLLMFIVPGVVAFIVDFGNGTVYEPGGGH
jgi:hypothetical protein